MGQSRVALRHPLMPVVRNLPAPPSHTGGGAAFLPGGLINSHCRPQRFGFPLPRASCYTRSVDVFVFRSESYDREFAFTLDSEGANLPGRRSLWRAPGGDIPSVVRDVQSVGRWGIILFGIKADGFYTLRADDDQIASLTAVLSDAEAPRRPATRTIVPAELTLRQGARAILPASKRRR